MSTLKLLKKYFSIRSTVYGEASSDFFRKMTPDELTGVQDCFFEILKDFSEACDKYGITYMLYGGNVLGSVRHKGPIPWDNDVDVVLPRKDMNKLIEIFDEALGDKYELTAPNSKYQVESIIGAIYKKGTYMPNIQTYGTDLPKGIHMDLFPMDYASENKLIRNVKAYISMALSFISVATLMRHNITPEKTAFYCSSKNGKLRYRIRMFAGFLFSFVSYRKWIDLFDRFIRSKKETSICVIAGSIANNFVSADMMLPPSKGPYGDLMLNLPHDPHAFLTKYYGDYMTLPPESKRLVHWIIDVNFDSDKAKK